MDKSTRLDGQAKGKSVSSTDERKPRVLAALKAASGASKVTSVVQMKDGRFAGHCMASIPRGYRSLGWWAVDMTTGAPDTASQAALAVCPRCGQRPANITGVCGDCEDQDYVDGE